MQNSWKRPKIKIAKTKSEWVWDIIGSSFYFGSIILLIYVWNVLPDKVPAHYNALGEVDRWGSKWELLLLPGIGLFIIIFLQVLEKFPEVHNYPKRLNETNAEQFYLLSRKMLNQTKNICLVTFSIILFQSVAVALGRANGIDIWLLPAVIIALGFPIVNGIIKQRKIK